MSSDIPRKFFRLMRNEDLQNGEIRVPKAFVSNRGDMNKKAKKCSTSKGNLNGRDEEIEEVELSDDIDNKSSDYDSDMPTQIQRTKNGKRKGRKRTINYRSCGENPGFELQLSRSYALGRCLRIPNDYSREYLKGFKGTVKIRFGDDKAMKVKLIIDANGSSIITKGWKSFAEKYNLKFKVGYICKFEMTQSNPFSFTITINPAIIKPCYKGRNSSSDNNIGVRNCNTKGTSSNRRVISDSKGRNVMKHDTFEVKVTSTVYQYVPNKFLHRHKECCGKFVELIVNGKSWSVKVKYHHQGSSRLSSGWTKFMKECKLEIGDRCRFKLIDEENFVFEVSYERKNVTLHPVVTSVSSERTFRDSGLNPLSLKV
ncbi:hypothetical protein P8452_06921 [Trifolium repens]|nr:hypothetical protein P8452_06921 [Trifolium repens]